MATIKTRNYNHKVTTDEVGNRINFIIRGSAMIYDLICIPQNQYDSVEDEQSKIIENALSKIHEN